MQESLQPINDLDTRLKKGDPLTEEDVSQAFNKVSRSLTETFARDPSKIPALQERLNNLENLWKEKIKAVKEAKATEKENVTAEAHHQLEGFQLAMAREWALLATDPKKGVGIEDYQGWIDYPPDQLHLTGVAVFHKLTDMYAIKNGTPPEKATSGDAVIMKAKELYDKDSDFWSFNWDKALEHDTYMKEFGFIEYQERVAPYGLSNEGTGFAMAYLKSSDDLFSKTPAVKKRYEEMFFGKLNELKKTGLIGEDNFQQLVDKGEKLLGGGTFSNGRTPTKEEEKLPEVKAYLLDKNSAFNSTYEKDYFRGTFEMDYLAQIPLPQKYFDEQVAPYQKKVADLQGKGLALSTNLGVSLDPKTLQLLQGLSIDTVSKDNETIIADAEKDMKGKILAKMNENFAHTQNNLVALRSRFNALKEKNLKAGNKKVSDAELAAVDNELTSVDGATGSIGSVKIEQSMTAEELTLQHGLITTIDNKLAAIQLTLNGFSTTSSDPSEPAAKTAEEAHAEPIPQAPVSRGSRNSVDVDVTVEPKKKKGPSMADIDRALNIGSVTVAKTPRYESSRRLKKRTERVVVVRKKESVNLNRESVEGTQDRVANRDSYKPYEEFIGPFRREESFKNNKGIITFEADWNGYGHGVEGGNADIELRVVMKESMNEATREPIPAGWIRYKISRKNVGTDGSFERMGYAPNFETAMAQIAHARRWAENYSETMKPMEQKKEDLFNKISSIKSYKIHENRIGRLVSFSVLPKNDVVQLYLDWGGGNSHDTKDNPMVNVWVNEKGGLTSIVNFSGQDFIQGATEYADFKGLVLDLEKIKKQVGKEEKITSDKYEAEAAHVLDDQKEEADSALDEENTANAPPKSLKGQEFLKEQEPGVEKFLKEKGLTGFVDRGYYQYLYPPFIHLKDVHLGQKDLHFKPLNPETAGFEKKALVALNDFLKETFPQEEIDRLGLSQDRNKGPLSSMKNGIEAFSYLARKLKEIDTSGKTEVAAKFIDITQRAIEKSGLSFDHKPSLQELQESYGDIFVPAWQQAESELDQLLSE